METTMDDFLVNKDNPQFQQDRMTQLVSTSYPTLTVEFKDNRSMRFRLWKEDKIIGFVKEQEELLASEIADKSDSALILLIDSVIKRSTVSSVSLRGSTIYLGGGEDFLYRDVWMPDECP